MFNAKIWLFVGVNLILTYSTITTATNNNDIVDNTDKKLKERLTVERNAYPYVVARKGVNLNSISARKGVDSITTEDTNLIEIEKKIETNDNKSKNIEKDLSIVKNSISQLDVKSNLTINNSTIKHINTMKKKFRPKPTATIGGIDDDNSKLNTHGLPTKSPPLGMPTKINYVIPVIITILILPLFVISMIYIYKNGRDCWEKRHYRRMDFLIDGMYNE